MSKGCGKTFRFCSFMFFQSRVVGFGPIIPSSEKKTTNQGLIFWWEAGSWYLSSDVIRVRAWSTIAKAFLFSRRVLDQGKLATSGDSMLALRIVLIILGVIVLLGSWERRRKRGEQLRVGMLCVATNACEHESLGCSSGRYIKS